MAETALCACGRPATVIMPGDHRGGEVVLPCGSPTTVIEIAGSRRWR